MFRAIFEDHKKANTFHHAYLIESAFSESEKQDLYASIEEIFGISVHSANPDFWAGTFDVFGVDDSRFLKYVQSRKPIFSPRKACVIQANSFTLEAQNALLKLFEEPLPHTHFFIVMKNSGTLLPTLESRLYRIRGEHVTDSKYDTVVERFIHASMPERITLLSDIIIAKDKARAVGFLDALTVRLYAESKKGMYNVSDTRDVLVCRDYLHDRSSSVKMLLEHVSATVPNISA